MRMEEVRKIEKQKVTDRHYEKQMDKIEIELETSN